MAKKKKLSGQITKQAASHASEGMTSFSLGGEDLFERRRSLY